MEIKTLKLKNYRNHTDLTLDFANTNIIVGPNGSGKSNIIEAIDLLSTTKPFRAITDTDIINMNAITANVVGDIFKSRDKDIIELIIQNTNTSKATKLLRINKIPRQLFQASQIFNTVLFTPDDMHIITGTPSIRRRYMDITLLQTDSDYKTAYTMYLKTVKQRNKILEKIKLTNRGQDELDIWTNKLIEYGIPIQNKRVQLINFVNEYLSNTEFKIDYIKTPLTTVDFVNLRQKEIQTRSTLLGPHRDDFDVYMGGLNMKSYSSRGQQRKAILELKNAEVHFINKIRGSFPVLLLDDVFSEFDDENIQNLIKVIQQQQTIITSTHIPSCIDGILDKVIRLETKT